jgi:hypothetical protein
MKNDGKAEFTRVGRVAARFIAPVTGHEGTLCDQRSLTPKYEEVLMDRSLYEARWLLAPILGLWITVTVVGVALSYI